MANANPSLPATRVNRLKKALGQSCISIDGSLRFESGADLADFLSYIGDPTVAAIPAGVVNGYAGATAPAGWLLCFGQSVLRTDYADLFAAIGTTFGAADGTHFTLPDLRGRVAAGKDNMGGVAASRLTTAVAGGTLGAVGGEQSHLLDVGELPAHSHNIPIDNDPADPVAPGDGAGVGTGTADNDIFTSQEEGGSIAHNNVQPTIVLNYIIKT